MHCPILINFDASVANGMDACDWLPSRECLIHAEFINEHGSLPASPHTRRSVQLGIMAIIHLGNPPPPPPQVVLTFRQSFERALYGATWLCCSQYNLPPCRITFAIYVPDGQTLKILISI